MKNTLNIKNIRNLLALNLIISLSILFTAKSYGQHKNDNSENKTLQLINQLEDKSPKKRQKTVVMIHSLGKEAIPELIENITNKRSVSFLLRNPRSSTLTESELGNSLGLTSAYLIELIVGHKDFSIEKEDTEYFIFGNSNNYIYWSGIIVNVNDKAIELSQLHKVKLQYEDWWSQIKDKSIATLREDWSQNKKPLSQSHYKWK